MKKKLLSTCLSALFLVAFTVVAEEEPCEITPKAGKLYEAGMCIDSVNMCLELPDGMMFGDCFREVVIE